VLLLLTVVEVRVRGAARGPEPREVERRAALEAERCCRPSVGLQNLVKGVEVALAGRGRRHTGPLQEVAGVEVQGYF